MVCDIGYRVITVLQNALEYVANLAGENQSHCTIINFLVRLTTLNWCSRFDISGLTIPNFPNETYHVPSRWISVCFAIINMPTVLKGLIADKYSIENTSKSFE